MQQQWVHIIGICGITTSGVAVMFKQMGWKVTGSDKGFFPPVSDFLKLHKIEINPGFKLERLHQDKRHPDLVVIQGTKSDKNEEYQEALRLGLKIMPYAEVLKEYVIHENSIVVVGSFGKTTVSSLLVNIFKQAKLSISYMYGGLDTDYSPNVVAKNELTQFSIVEGDEYLTSFKDKSSKFFHYKPKYLIINGIEYDHVDLFSSFEDYLANFKKIIAQIPRDGIIVANIDDQNVQKALTVAQCKVVTFSGNQNLQLKPDWYLLRESKPLPTIIKNVKEFNDELVIIPLERNVIGSFNDVNMLAAAVMSNLLGIKPSVIQAGIKNYKGIQRRLQIKCSYLNWLIIDDFGSTPAKAEAAIKTIKIEYPQFKIISIFEPNSGNRDYKALKLFKNTFKETDLVIIPKFTMIPKSANKKFSENDLSEYLIDNGINAEFLPVDVDVLTAIKHAMNKHKKAIILFLGSHSFRGMVNKIVEILENGKAQKSTTIK